MANGVVDLGQVRGADGVTPNLQVGTVRSVPSDQPAAVRRDPESPDSDPVFHFDIPKGEAAEEPGDMQSSVYDPQRRAMDVFGYAKMLYSPPLLASYTTAGTVEWENTTGKTIEVLVAFIGGGGGSHVVVGPAGTHPMPGTSGHARVEKISLVPGGKITGVVGAGGAGGAGGTTSVNGVSAWGGFSNGNNAGGSIKTTVGGQAITHLGYIGYYEYEGSFLSRLDSIDGGWNVSDHYIKLLLSIFPANKLPFMCAVCDFYGKSDTLIIPPKQLLNGNVTASTAHFAVVPEQGYQSTRGTDPGCGGGGVSANSGDVNKLKASPGCDGGIFLYDVSHWEGI